MGKTKHQKKKKSNLILIMNVLSIILLITTIFFLNYDLKSSQKEWESHINKGDFYAGKGKWIQTRPLINTKDTEPPIYIVNYEVVNDPLSGIQININKGD